MKTYLIWAGIALCVFSLWSIGRNDWLRITRPCVRVLARVASYRSNFDKSGRHFAAVYRFSAEGAEHDVIDQVYSSTRRPEIGQIVELRYPEGRPDLARPPRVLMWIAVYITLLTLMGMIFAKWMGWL
jgi:hypothetical protein